jgi:hypothetical protein
MSLLRFVAASRVCITGFGLYARFGVGDLLAFDCDAMPKSKRRGAAFADRSDSGDDLGGVYGE